MKKVVFTMFMVAVAYTANSQENNGQTAKGKVLIELNTQLAGNINSLTNTGISFTNVNGFSGWSLGLGGGYFVADNLAVKAGLGYSGGSHGVNSSFAYRFGAKYYLKGKIPFEVDVSGSNVDMFSDKPLFVGLSGGYAFFLGDKLSIEPKLQYSIPLKNKLILKKSLSLGVSFAIHL